MTRLAALREKYPTAWPEHVLAEFAGACRRGERTFAEARELEAALTAGLRALEVVDALDDMLNMIDGLRPDFSNGVTDSTGTMDEGRTLASAVLDRARAALAAAKGQP